MQSTRESNCNTLCPEESSSGSTCHLKKEIWINFILLGNGRLSANCQLIKDDWWQGMPLTSGSNRSVPCMKPHNGVATSRISSLLAFIGAIPLTCTRSHPADLLVPLHDRRERYLGLSCVWSQPIQTPENYQRQRIIPYSSVEKYSRRLIRLIPVPATASIYQYIKQFSSESFPTHILKFTPTHRSFRPCVSDWSYIHQRTHGIPSFPLGASKTGRRTTSIDGIGHQYSYFACLIQTHTLHLSFTLWIGHSR